MKGSKQSCLGIQYHLRVSGCGRLYECHCSCAQMFWWLWAAHISLQVNSKCCRHEFSNITDTEFHASSSNHMSHKRANTVIDSNHMWGNQGSLLVLHSVTILHDRIVQQEREQSSRTIPWGLSPLSSLIVCVPGQRISLLYTLVSWSIKYEDTRSGLSPQNTKEANEGRE